MDGSDEVAAVDQAADCFDIIVQRPILEERCYVLTNERVRQRMVVCLEPKSRRTEDGILIVPAREFCTRLNVGDLF